MVLGWCRDCNVPIIDARPCGVCGKDSYVIKSREVKPVFSLEKERIEKLLIKNRSQISLPVNTYTFIDLMGFVIIDGFKIFRVNFSEKTKKWQIHETKSSKNLKELQGSDFSSIIKANEYILKEKEEEAVSFIENIIFKHPELPLAISFSGGKDSTVALHLAKQVKNNVDVIFLDTTIELPETLQFIRKIADLWNLNLISVKPSHDFLDLCHVIGPPSRFMKWCCKTQKFSPMNKLLHEKYSDGVIMIRGVRAAESNNRSNYKRSGRLKWTPKEVIVNPILHWSSFDSWLYIFWKRIPYNDAYEYGFTRLGCWACPSKSLKDFAILEEFHPELARKLHLILKEYAVKHNLDDNWIDSGAWRVRKSRVNKIPVRQSKLCGGEADQNIVFTLDSQKRVKTLLEFFKVFGYVQKKGRAFIVNNKDVEAMFLGNKIRLKIKNERLNGSLIGYVERALNCVGCGACQSICDNGAIIQVNGKRVIDQKKCINCLKCISFTCIALKYGSNRFSLSDYSNESLVKIRIN